MEESSLRGGGGGVSFSGDAVGSGHCPRHSAWSGRYEQVSKLLAEVVSAKVKGRSTRGLGLRLSFFRPLRSKVHSTL